MATAALSLYNFCSRVTTMSKSDFDSAYRPKRYLDVIEPQWLQDTLSDDEVEIPLEIDIPHDDADIDAGESEAARKEESKWTDLDLDAFRPRE